MHDFVMALIDLNMFAFAAMLVYYGRPENA